MKLTNTLYSLVFILALASVNFGCSGKDIDESDPQALFNDAEEDVKDERYQMALEKMKIVKNKFPYSHLATKARLRVADIHFLDEEYIESAGAYETFRDLHPKYEKADYVIFKIGESYFNQLPSKIDRDLSSSAKAIEAYNELTSVYPKSEHLEEAKKHLNQTLEKLAAKENYIAEFYFKRDMYDSSSKRYEKITKNYPGSENVELAYWRWAKCLLEMSKDPERRDKKTSLLDEARHVYRTYLARHSGGRYVSDVNKALEGLAWEQ